MPTFKGKRGWAYALMKTSEASVIPDNMMPLVYSDPLMVL
jgi:hypothetical protein